MLKHIAIWVILFAVFVLALKWIGRRALFHPAPATAETITPPAGVEEVWLETEDGVRIHAWWKPAPSASLASLYLHGNAGNLMDRTDILHTLPAAGISVLLLDYRGYGRSAGWPSTDGFVRDAVSAWSWLRRRGYSERRLVLHGESIGTGVALEISRQVNAAGVVLEAPFTSLEDMAATAVPWLGPLVVRGYRSIDAVRRLRCPVLIIHGSEDEVVPVRMGRALYEAAPEPKQLWIVDRAGHNDLRTIAAPQLVSRLRAFYQSLPQ